MARKPQRDDQHVIICPPYRWDEVDLARNGLLFLGRHGEHWKGSECETFADSLRVNATPIPQKQVLAARWICSDGSLFYWSQDGERQEIAPRPQLEFDHERAQLLGALDQQQDPRGEFFQALQQDEKQHLWVQAVGPDGINHLLHLDPKGQPLADSSAPGCRFEIETQARFFAKIGYRAGISILDRDLQLVADLAQAQWSPQSQTQPDLRHQKIHAAVFCEQSPDPAMIIACEQGVFCWDITAHQLQWCFATPNPVRIARPCHKDRFFVTQTGGGLWKYEAAASPKLTTILESGPANRGLSDNADMPDPVCSADGRFVACEFAVLLERSDSDADHLTQALATLVAKGKSQPASLSSAQSGFLWSQRPAHFGVLVDTQDKRIATTEAWPSPYPIWTQPRVLQRLSVVGDEA